MNGCGLMWWMMDMDEWDDKCNEWSMNDDQWWNAWTLMNVLNN